MLRAGARAEQSTPITMESGAVLGMISIHFPVPHRPADEDVQALDVLACNVAALIGGLPFYRTDSVSAWPLRSERQTVSDRGAPAT